MLLYPVNGSLGEVVKLIDPQALTRLASVGTHAAALNAVFVRVSLNLKRRSPRTLLVSNGSREFAGSIHSRRMNA